MASQDPNGAGRAPIDFTAGTLVVSRDGFGDMRKVRLLEEQITGACIAVARGGHGEWLPEPSPAVWAPAYLYPIKWRSGEHDPQRGNMRLMLERDGTDPDVYARVLVEASKRVHTREHVERQRAKQSRRPAAREETER